MKKEIYICDRCGRQVAAAKTKDSKDYCPACFTWFNLNQEEKIEVTARSMQDLFERLEKLEKRNGLNQTK